MVLLSLLVSFGCLAIVACGGNEGQSTSSERVTYTLTLKTEAGKPVSGAFVRAYLDGSQKTIDVSNSQGVIVLSLAPAEYTLVVDETSLNPGYTPAQEYTTHAYSEEIDIIINIGVIDGTAPEGTVYSLGDVMYDFTLQEVETKENITLSEILAEKDMVMLNFFYNGCVPCQNEFPYMSQAYNEYSDDIAIIAINYLDGAAAAAEFKQEHNLPFYVCSDTALYRLFSQPTPPTSIIIDRYGVICMSHTGGINSADTFGEWFESFIGDDYVQA